MNTQTGGKEIEVSSTRRSTTSYYENSLYPVTVASDRSNVIKGLKRTNQIVDFETHDVVDE
jgi:hypothetical protein